MSKSRADPAFEISSGDGMILPERHPACRRREPQPGTRTEPANLRVDAKGKATSGSNREGESSEAIRRGGAARRSASISWLVLALRTPKASNAAAALPCRHACPGPHQTDYRTRYAQARHCTSFRCRAVRVYSGEALATARRIVGGTIGATRTCSATPSDL